MMVRIMIVDDHAIVRLGLKEILEHGLKDVHCLEVNNGEEAISQVSCHQWDLVILDLTLPGLSGLEVLKAIKISRPKLPVLVLSMHSEQEYGRRVFRAGGEGFMNKGSAPDELMTAVRRLLHGGRYVGPGLAELLASDLSLGRDALAHEALSDREFEVLRKIGAGNAIGQIAEEMNLSVQTVSTYRSRLLSKLGLKTTAELVRFVLEHKLD
jgi:DNA-binding NarL/FixJ family response regulator